MPPQWFTTGHKVGQHHGGERPDGSTTLEEAQTPAVAVVGVRWLLLSGVPTDIVDTPPFGRMKPVV